MDPNGQPELAAPAAPVAATVSAMASANSMNFGSAAFRAAIGTILGGSDNVIGQLEETLATLRLEMEDTPEERKEEKKNEELFATESVQGMRDIRQICVNTRECPHRNLVSTEWHGVYLQHCTDCGVSATASRGLVHVYSPQNGGTIVINRPQ